jgi:hypothetical protein
MEIDASDFAMGAMLSQKKKEKDFNYEIHNKELLAIVDSFQEWRHLLKGASY